MLGDVRLVLLLFLAVWLVPPVTAVADDGLDQIRQRGTLVWGADQEGGGPFVYPDPDDPTRLIGFEVELARVDCRAPGRQRGILAGTMG